MNPWFAWWAPNYVFPLGGDVVQKIAPETDWFSTNISADVGDSDIEREIFQNVAPYGKQIGILAEIILTMAEESDSEAIKGLRALEQLKELQKKVEKIKSEKKERFRDNAKKVLDKFAKTDPEGLKELLKSYQI
jgi:hypothetical protein